MKRTMISALAAIVLFAAATIMLRSHAPTSQPVVASATTIAPVQLQSATDGNKLPVEDFEDRSLVFSRAKQ